MLSEDGQILFATEQKDAQDGAVMVQALPDGNLADYQYIDGEYIYHPLPKPEAPEPVPAPTVEERIAQLEAQNQMLTECLMEMSQIVYA